MHFSFAAGALRGEQLRLSDTRLSRISRLSKVVRRTACWALSEVPQSSDGEGGCSQPDSKTFILQKARQSIARGFQHRARWW